MEEFISFLKVNASDYILNADMSQFTTLKIGGKADVLIQPSSVDELKKIIDAAKQNNVKLTFIGNGSNILVRDKGVRGAVIKFGKNFAAYNINGNVIEVLSGISMAKIASVAAENSLTGFEFASGIPGTIGGGIVMNAGAYKGELADVVFEVDALCADGTVKTFTKDQLDFSYRHSCFSGTDMLVLKAKIKLNKGNKEEIIARINEFSAKRRTTQPLEYPSAGSAFKRPQNGYAAAMIDECGLKGFAIGGAEVSQKHAGFVINKNNATASDVIDLLNAVKEKVFAKFGTMLETEIVTIGEE